MSKPTEHEDAIIYQITKSQLREVIAEAHICQQEESVKEFTTRLAMGDVALARIEERLEAQDVKTETNAREMNVKLDAIKEQTTKTNGRVNTHDEVLKKPRFGWPAACATVAALVGGLIVISQVILDFHHDSVAFQKMEIIGRSANVTVVPSEK